MVFPTRLGGRFVLCVDGLTNKMSDETIAEVPREWADAEQTAEELELVRRPLAQAGGTT